MLHISGIKVPVTLILQTETEENIKIGRIGEKETELIRKRIAKKLRKKTSEVRELSVIRKSMDARKKQEMCYSYQALFTCADEEECIKRYGKNDIKRVQDSVVKEENGKQGSRSKGREKLLPPVVIGFGPAGMFAALTLARAGLEPVVIERGMEVEKRQQCVEAYWNTGRLNPESNVQFGEGGAGTFSDGKLNTLVKDKEGRVRKVLETFVSFGAPSEILYLQKPHIGTDRLKEVVKEIRKEILRLGGKIYFETKFVDFEAEEGRLKKIYVETEKQVREIKCEQLILAAGHSARDTFYKLYDAGLVMERKPFAIGVRIEHPQEMIGRGQYGEAYEKLPAADYKLTYQTKEGRGVYSFCMCPGGFVVDASSEEGRIAVNGMSDYRRDGKNANSAIVVTVSPDDFGGKDVLAGIEFQRKYEELAYREGKGRVPVQLFGDYLEGKVSTGYGGFSSERRGNAAFGNLRNCLPVPVGNAIAEGILAFDKKIHSFGREDAILSGVETRTSSPIRILRDASFMSNVSGIYPCGEGAGYAGGITSASADGMRIAEAVIRHMDK